MSLLYCLILLSMMSFSGASNKKIEVKKSLIRSNKTPLKSIKSPDGDIIDCIHIYDQPAFDHPLLKNHTILTRPSYYSNKGLLNARSQENTNPTTQLWQLSGECPDNTIPIRRNLNSRKIKKYANKQFSSYDMKLDDRSRHEHVVAYVNDNKYLGAKATINVWEPKVQNHFEFSLSQIWVVGGGGSNLNTIEAGWTVDPALYGDNRTRLFLYWTKDNYRFTGCYDLRCPGFVHTSTKIAMGATLAPVSTYHGPQFEITLYMVKDQQYAVWWLQFGNDVVGYWPASLFTSLDRASLVEWGGEVINIAPNGQHTTTEMGSGHFPEEQFGGASYFKDLQVVDESNTLRPPGKLLSVVEKPNCYKILLGKDVDGGDFFYYGGPGRNASCP